MGLTHLVYFPKAAILTHGCTWRAYKKKEMPRLYPKLVKSNYALRFKGRHLLSPSMFTMHIRLRTTLKGKSNLYSKHDSKTKYNKVIFLVQDPLHLDI